MEQLVTSSLSINALKPFTVANSLWIWFWPETSQIDFSQHTHYKYSLSMPEIVNVHNDRPKGNGNITTVWYFIYFLWSI